MSGVIGQPISRVDGPAKVAGSAPNAAEFDLPDLAYAVVVSSTIPTGCITAIDAEAAKQASGVLTVISHENAPRLPYRPRKNRPPVDPQTGEQLRIFQGPKIYFSGQPVAVVVAETLEAARYAASLVEVQVEAAVAVTLFNPDRGDLRVKAT